MVLESLRDADDKFAQWTLVNVRRMCADKDYRAAVIKRVDHVHDVERSASGMLPAALRYFENEFELLAENTRSSIAATVDSWLTPIVGHRDLITWAEASHGVDPTEVLRGKMIGVSTPFFKYGRAGLAVQNLIKSRIYAALRRRGSEWQKQQGQTAVLLLIDEAQDILSAQDDIFAVARSLGLIGCCATQTIDGLNARQDEDSTKALLGNFRSLVCFQSSPATLDYMSERLGCIPRRMPMPVHNGMAIPNMVRHKIEGIVIGGRGGGKRKWKNSPAAGAIKATASMIVGIKEDGNVAEGIRFDDSGNLIVNYKTEIRPLLDKGEAEAWLRAPFYAIAQVQRGQVIRRDVIKTTPKFNTEPSEKSTLDNSKGKVIEARSQVAQQIPVFEQPVAVPKPKSCPKCDLPVAEDEIFCGNCGNKLK